MRRRPRDDEGGFSLVETLVGMSLFLLIGTLTLNAVVTGLRSQTGLTERASAMENLRTAAQRISRDVRQADPVLRAEDRLLILRQSLTGGGTRDLTYQVVGSDLVQDEKVTSATGTVTTAPRRTVVRRVDPTAPLFGYVYAVGYVPSSPTVSATTCVIAATSPVRYSTDCIGRITLRLSRTLTKGTPLKLDQTMELRNR